MNAVIRISISLVAVVIGVFTSGDKPLDTTLFVPAAIASVPSSTTMPAVTATIGKPADRPRYQHGDCSWIPAIARNVGWTDHEMDQLIHIILRESGCCPNRRGGDRVNKDCEIVKVVSWHHRSDTGLLQINGVHWKQDHPQYAGLVCERMGICTQEPLFDPETNLAAGRLLWQVAGWQPWTPQPKPRAAAGG